MVIVTNPNRTISKGNLTFIDNSLLVPIPRGNKIIIKRKKYRSIIITVGSIY